MPKKIKVLLIDDEEDFCHFVKLNLERTQEFEVSISTDGSRGIDLAKKEHPDIIVLDIIMPEVSGSEVAQYLQSDNSTKDIPIIFLTAIVKKDEIESEKGTIGGRKFLAKPITAEELTKEIKEVLNIT